MKKAKSTKKLFFLNLLFLAFFAFSFDFARASDKIPDICESKYKDSFKSFCEKRHFLKTGESEKTETPKLLSAKESPETTSLSSEEDEHNITISGEEEWTGDKTFDNKLIEIESGAELKIKAGTTVSLRNSIIVVFGKLIAEGTPENRVKIQALQSEGNYGYCIGATKDDGNEHISEIEMRYTDISGGGVAGDIPGAILIEASILKMEECRIYDNEGGFILTELSSDFKVSRTKFWNNNFDVISVYPSDPGSYPDYDFQYNWWGGRNGPEKESGGEYKKIYGNIDVSPWFVSEDFFDPVIVVPGIMGSAWEGFALKLDPIMHTYDNLTLSFEDNGYEKGKNLFEFPYEWRNSNVYTADRLKEKIDEVKEETGLPAVNIVAHSMGGLIARQYIEGENYDNDVNQLITLGTPHRGAPKTYPRWEAGEGFFEVDELVVKKLFQVEALHSGYLDLGKYIREKVESVGQLLPNYNYLKEASSGEIRIYPGNYPGNIFLDTLNTEGNIDKLNRINLTNIIGNLTGPDKTISGFKVVDSDEEDAWQHGMPDNFYDSSTDRGIEYGLGDQTVPLESATGINTGENIEVNSAHQDLPTKSQCDVIRKLTGKEECEYANEIDRIVDVLTFGVFSPVDIQVIDSDGNWAGRNILGKPETEMIPGAYYSGSETENEFLAIPVSGEGKYEIIAKGTGSGNYKIEVSRISEEGNPNEAKEITATIPGTAVLNQEQKIELKVEENEIISGSDQAPPEILISSPEENKTYPNSQIVPMEYEIKDDASPAERITKEIYLDGDVFLDEEIDLAFLHIGTHILKIYAADEAGNKSEKEAVFRSEASIKSTLSNTNRYYSLSLIKKQDKTIINGRLELVERFQKMIEALEGSNAKRGKITIRLIENIKKQANSQLDWLSAYVRNRINPKLKNSIDLKIGELLIEDFNFLKY